MDKQLRALRLKALQDNKDPDILWRYIRVLERSCGVDDSPRKLFAVLNDGTLEGDSIFGAHSEAFQGLRWSKAQGEGAGCYCQDPIHLQKVETEEALQD